MFKNYFKIAIRNLLRHKLFSFINIFGLALSMSICLLIIIHLKDQLDYDTFHPHAARTYRILTELKNKEGTAYRFASSPLPLAPELLADYNFVEEATRLYTAASDKVIAGNDDIPVKSAFTDASFFRVFGFTLQIGNAQTALVQPNSIVLSQESAQTLFGKKNPLGETITMQRLGSFQVTGVFQKPAAGSHIDFEAYISMSSVASMERSGILPEMLTTWNPQAKTYTYLTLKTGVRKMQLQDALHGTAARLMRTSALNGKENITFDVQPLNKIILGEELMNEFGNVGSWGKMLAEIVIGLIILLSACFNYTNLSIARSLSRGKEVGIRKVAGAFRYQVFYQFILESVLIAFLALALSRLLLQLMIEYAPFIEGGRPDRSIDAQVYLWFVLFTLFTGIIAGALPAWVLSSFKPVQVLKNLSNIKLFGGNRFRQVLIITQFTLALIIIIFTNISSRQFNFIATANPGYERDNLLVVPLKGIDAPLLTAEIYKVSGVREITAVSTMPGRDASGNSKVSRQPKEGATHMEYYDVDTNFPEVMRLKLIAGRSFSPQANVTREAQVLLSETAVASLHFSTAVDAIGKIIYINDTLAVQVAGVVKNFHYHGLAVQTGPLMLRNRASNFNFLAVKTANHNAAIKNNVEAALNKNYPLRNFSTSWFGEELFKRQAAWGTVSMIGFLAFMSVTIACLGLLGMVIYNTETRRKEIGIRKVMGASVTTIISLLSKSFLKLVLIAGCIAIPAGYICGLVFLNIFANRISIGADTMLLSFMGLLLLVVLTISSQIFMVATANPVKSLRTE